MFAHQASQVGDTKALSFRDDMGPGTLREPHTEFLSHTCKNRIGLFSLQEHSFKRTSWAGDHVLFQWAQDAGGTSLGSREPGVLDGRVRLPSSSRAGPVGPVSHRLSGHRAARVAFRS